MPTTLETPPLQAAHDDRPGLIPGAVMRAPETSLETAPKRDVGSYITPAVASALAVATIGAVVVGAAGWADINPFPIIAAGVLVLVAGLFARVRFSGGRHTPLVGALLLPVLALGATAAPYLDDGVGDRSHHPTSFDDVEAEYQLGIGNLHIDFRDIEFPPGEHVISIEHGIGAARVQLPADVSYSATGDVSIGKLDLLGQSDDGFNTTFDAEAKDVGSATIVLEFDTSIGYGSVERD